MYYRRMYRCVYVGGVRAEWTRFERDDNIHKIKFINIKYHVLYFNHQNIRQSHGRAFLMVSKI